MMGKSKKQQRQRQQPRFHDHLPSSAFDVEGECQSGSVLYEDDNEGGSEGVQEEVESSSGLMDKHALYQRSVQSPKGDISYLQKFFLTYVGRRTPIHLREDFCGTALLCAEWVRADARRTAVGVDLDKDALAWGLLHNMSKIGPDAQSRIHLFQGNVLHALAVERKVQVLNESELLSGADTHSISDSIACRTSSSPAEHRRQSPPTDSAEKLETAGSGVSYGLTTPGADIICAFNYSCCCLHKRVDLITYFKRARQHLSCKGGIFVMDLYGGSSSECALKLRRRFPDFTYKWEQEEFDVLTRTTRISLHFQLKNHRVLRRAFSYSWRLWTIPEVRDCLEEAGFDATYVWVRQMCDLQGRNNDDDEDADMGCYEEVAQFQQCDAWNAYIVAVFKAH